MASEVKYGVNRCGDEDQGEEGCMQSVQYGVPPALRTNLYYLRLSCPMKQEEKELLKAAAVTGSSDVN